MKNFRTDSIQRPIGCMSSVHNAATELPNNIKDEARLLYCSHQNWKADPTRLDQFVYYTISGGCHFPQKINDDCLPWLLDKSFSMYGPHIEGEKIVKFKALSIEFYFWNCTASNFLLLIKSGIK